MKLTPKEQAFIKLWPVTMCQVESARRAGYKAPEQMGKQLMWKPEIRDAIRQALEKRLKKYEAEADQVIQDLADIAHLDKSQIFQIKDGRLIVTDTNLLPERVRRCISKVSQTQHGIRIEFDDRVKALELLGRHLALFTDNLNVSGQPKDRPIDEMTEEQIDAELSRIARKKAAAGEKKSTGTQQPA